jgi:hypothetical protein
VRPAALERDVTRRLLLVAAAVLCLCGAAFAALLATDVGSWQSAFRSADARASVAVPTADETLPFHLARDVLGLGDDLAFRHALVLFHRGYTGIPSADQSTQGTEARAEAEASLERVVREEGDGSRASEAADLLGVLELVDASGGSNSGSGGSVDRAIVELQNAVRLDSSNGDAKANLELALGLAPPDSPFSSTRHGSTGRRRGGASETTPGRGY